MVFIEATNQISFLYLSLMGTSHSRIVLGFPSVGRRRRAHAAPRLCFFPVILRNMAAVFQVAPEFVAKFGKTYPADVFLAKENDPGSTMFIITQGKVRVYKHTTAGEKDLAQLGAGDFFGEMALLGLQDKRSATVKTVTETQVLELNRQAFEAIITRSADLAMVVIKALAERVRDANGKLGAIIHKEDFMRISAYIQYLAIERGVPALPKNLGACFVFKRDTAASTLNLSPSVIDKYLEMAKKARFLAQNGDWMWAPFPQYLLPFADYILKKAL